MFILDRFKEKICVNYPKYMIIQKNNIAYNFNSKSMFYYLVSSNINHTCISNKYPNYLIVPDLSFNWYNTSEKFDLSKLGTDYLFNYICIHYKDECIGSYPENYVFVNEPDWPYKISVRTDRTPLKHSSHPKRSYQSKEI